MDKEQEKQQLEAAQKVYEKIAPGLVDSKGEELETWDKLPKYEKVNISELVQKIESNPAITVEDLHNYFVKRQYQKGWKLGKRNGVHKTHPNIVAYDALQLNTKEFYFALLSSLENAEEEEYSVGHIFYKIAKVCHNVNKAYCESIGDDTQPSWEEAPDWQKESAINGVIYHSKNPESKPSDSHENWMAEKLQDGWKYGKVKDPETKEHPCIAPYNELPIEQRTKDYLFIAVVKSIQE